MEKEKIKVNWTIQGWIARDSELGLFSEKPSKGNELWMGNLICLLPKEMFPELTWESEPILVDITFKRV